MLVKKVQQIFFIISCLMYVGLQAFDTPYRFSLDTYNKEQRSALSLDKGSILCAMGSCSLGFDVSSLIPLFKAASNCFKSRAQEKQFVQKYSGWDREQFHQEALQRFAWDHENAFLSDDMQNILLAEHHLYQFQGFQDLIKTFPVYEDYIKELHKKVSIDSRAGKQWWKDFPGFKHQSFTNLLDMLYKRVADAEKARQKQEQKKRESIQKEQQTAAQRERIARERLMYEHVLSVVADGPSLSLVNKKDRMQAIERTLQEDLQKLERQFECKAYALSFAAQYGIQESFLKDGLIMDAYQYQLHTEFIEQLTAASVLQGDYRHIQRVNVFLDALGNGVSQGIDASKNNQLESATYWADVGWQALDLAQAMAEGVGLGVYNAATFVGNTVVHPIDTMVTTAHGIGNMVELLARVTGTMIGLDHALEHDHQEYAVIVRNTVEQVDALINHCARSAQNMPTRDKVKNATAFVTEFFVTSKALQVAGAIGARMRPLLVECLEVASAARKEQVGLAAAGVGENVMFHATEEGAMAARVSIEAASDAKKILIDFSSDLSKKNHSDIAFLKARFNNTKKGFAEFANKYIKPSYEHFFEMEFSFNSKGVSGINGFHHDFMNAIEHGGVIKFVDKKVGRFGVYQAELFFNETRICRKTFFPAEWPKEKVISAILEAYEDALKCGKFLLGSDGKYQLLGCTNEGIAIELFITKNGNIKTAYPILMLE